MLRCWTKDFGDFSCLHLNFNMLWSCLVSDFTVCFYKGYFWGRFQDRITRLGLFYFIKLLPALVYLNSIKTRAAFKINCLNFNYLWNNFALATTLQRKTRTHLKNPEKLTYLTTLPIFWIINERVFYNKPFIMSLKRLLTREFHSKCVEK